MADSKIRDSHFQSSAASITSRIMAYKGIRMVNFSSDSSHDIDNINSSIHSEEEYATACETLELPSLGLSSAISAGEVRSEENVRKWLMDMDGRELGNSLVNGGYDEIEREDSIVHKQNDDSIALDNFLLIRDLRKKRYSKNSVGTKQKYDRTVTENVLIQKEPLQIERHVENCVVSEQNDDSTVADQCPIINDTSLPNQTKIQEHFKANNHSRISSNKFRSTKKSKGTQHSTHKKIIQIRPKKRLESNDSNVTNEIELTRETDRFSATKKAEGTDHLMHKNLVQIHSNNRLASDDSRVTNEDVLINDAPLLDKTKISGPFNYEIRGDISKNDFNDIQRGDDTTMLINETGGIEHKMSNTDDHKIFSSSRCNTSTSKDNIFSSSDGCAEVQNTSSHAFCSSRITTFDLSTSKIDKSENRVQLEETTPDSMSSGKSATNNSNSETTERSYQEWLQVTAQSLLAAYDNIKRGSSFENMAEFQSCGSVTNTGINPLESDHSKVGNIQLENNKTYFVSVYGGQQFATPVQEREEGFEQFFVTRDQNANDKIFRYFGSETTGKENPPKFSRSLNYLTEKKNFNGLAGTSQSRKNVTSESVRTGQLRNISVKDLNNLQELKIPIGLLSSTETINQSKDQPYVRNDMSLLFRERPSILNSSINTEIRKSFEELQRTNSITNAAANHYYQNSNIDINKFSNNENEMSMETETNEETDTEVIPNIKTLLQLLSVDPSISKSILIALSSRQFRTGATLIDIETYIRQKQVAKTLSKLRQDIRNFLDAALDVQIIKRKRRRYILPLRTQLIGRQIKKQIKKASKPVATVHRRKRNIRNMSTKITRRNKILNKMPTKKTTDKLTNKRNPTKDNDKPAKTIGKKPTPSKHLSTTPKGQFLSLKTPEF